MSNNSNNSDLNSPRRLFVQNGGASGGQLNLPFLFTSGQLGISSEIEEVTTTRLKKSTSSMHREDELLVEEQKLINKSIAELFYNNHNITDKKRAGYAKNVIEQAPSMHDETGGAFFLDDAEEDFDEMGEEEQEVEEQDDYEDEEDRQTKKEFEKISQQLSEQLKNSPHKNDYLDTSSKHTSKGSPRISLKTGLSSEFNSSRSSSRNSASTATSSVKSSDMLKIDPNYKWLLKDLKLSNNKRVIDVTDLIDLNESTKQENSTSNAKRKEDKNILIDTSNIVNESITGDNNPNTSSSTKEDNNESLLKQEQKLLNQSDQSDKDSSYISKLYKKLVNTSVNNNDKTTDIEDDQDHAAPREEKLNERVIRQIDEDDAAEDGDEEEEDDEELLNAYANHNDSVYKKFTSSYREKNNKNIKSDSTSSNDEIEEYDNVKSMQTKQRFEQVVTQRENLKGGKQFSKSFEVSIEDLDNLIDRVDNGIKLKRSTNGKKPTEAASKAASVSEKQEQVQQQQQQQPPQQLTIESLKQEWSQMFTKLEQDYKSKLEEQQRSNELKLKQLHDEIKQSIVLQQQSINNELHKQDQLKQEQLKSVDLKSTITFENKEPLSKQPSSSSSATATSANSISPNNLSTSNSAQQLQNAKTNLIDNNSKYITNLRLELKSKHSRHVQDLKEYYEKELDELKRKLNFYEKQHNGGNSSKPTVLAKVSGDLLGGGNESDTNSVNDLDDNFSDISSTKQQQIQNDKNHALLNSELKTSNSTLLNKLYESSQHIRYLTQENCDLTNKINQMDVELKQANEKITNLEHCCTQLELQLTDTIKLQDQYIRELHAEKRNLVKKMQECEELKMSCKFFEQKCDTLELKLDEKDSVITRLKTQLIQAETDLNRLEYEYKKSMSNTKMSQTITEKPKTPTCGQQITIKNQQQQQQQQQLQVQQQQGGQHPIPVIITNTNNNNNNNNSTNGSGTSSSSMSPSSPNSMSKTTITTSTTTTTTNTSNSKSNANGSLTNGFANSASMSQLNSQRLNIQNDTNNANSINNVSSLLITDATKDPLGTNLRQFQFSTDRINSYSRRSQHDYQHNPFRQSRNMSVSPTRLIERDELNRNYKNPITGSNTTPNNLQSTSVYSIKANAKFQSDILGGETANTTTNNILKPNETSTSTKQLSHQQQQQQQQIVNNNNTNTNSTNNGTSTSSTNGGIFKLVPDIQLKYIEHLECEFDMLMKHKQQLDAQLTRLPYKATNTNMHTLRQSVENELNLVEKKLASVKLELRKLNIIKTH